MRPTSRYSWRWIGSRLRESVNAVKGLERGEAKNTFKRHETESHRTAWRKLAEEISDSYRTDKLEHYEKLCGEAADASRLNNNRKVNKIIQLLSRKSQKIFLSKK